MDTPKTPPLIKLIWCSCLLTAQLSVAQIDFFQAAESGNPFIGELFEYDTIDFAWNMSGPAQAALNEGINQLQEHRPNVATVSFDQAIALDSKLWMAFYYRAVSNKILAKFELAEFDFLKAVELNPKLTICYLELGKINQLQGKERPAENFYSKYIKANPGNRLGYYYLAGHALNHGNMNEAARLYKKSIAFDSTIAIPFVKLGLIEFVKKSPRKTYLDYFEQALKTDPNQQHALLFHGLVYSEDDKKRSLADFSKLIQLFPEKLNYRVLRGMLLTEMEDFDPAFADLHFALQKQQLNEASFKGQQTFLDKRIDLQYAGYYTILNVYGLQEKTASLVKKSFCQLLVGKYIQAQAALQDALLIENHALIFFLLAISYEHTGIHERALMHYDKALRLDNDLFDAHKKRGVYRMEMKQWKLSINDFNDMIRINPENYFAYKLRGVSNYNLNKFENAASDFNKYLDHDTTDLEVYSYRGMTYFAKQDSLHGLLDFIQSNATDYLMMDYLVRHYVGKESVSDVIKKLESASKRFPIDSVKMKSLVVRTQMKSEDWKSVWDNATKIIAIGKFPGARYHSFLLTAKAYALLNWNNPQEALSMLKKAINENPDNGEAFLLRGKILLQQKLDKEAKDNLLKADKLGEKEAKAYLKKI